MTGDHVAATGDDGAKKRHAEIVGNEAPELLAAGTPSVRTALGIREAVAFQPFSLVFVANLTTKGSTLVGSDRRAIPGRGLAPSLG